MGKRGPPKKPTKLQLLKGNPGRRPLNRREPRPRARMPRVPAHLSAPAKTAWKMIAPKLHRLGLLTEIDGLALGLLCDSYGRYLEAEKKLRKEGELIKTEKGNLVQSPYLAIRNRHFDQIRRLLAEFGMTPSARANLETLELPDIDPMEEYLQQRGRRKA